MFDPRGLPAKLRELLEIPDDNRRGVPSMLNQWLAQELAITRPASTNSMIVQLARQKLGLAPDEGPWGIDALIRLVDVLEPSGPDYLISPAFTANASVTAVLGSAFDADAQSIFDAMDTEPNAARKERINTAVVALKDDGIWSKLDRLWVMAAHEQGVTSRLDWKSPATTGHRLTEVNSPTFTADQGYTGNGSNMYLDTNYTPSIDGINWTLDSASLGAGVSTVNSSGTSDYAGVRDDANSRAQIVRAFGGNPWQVRGPNDGNSLSNATNSNLANGLLVANRSAADARQGYRNGVLEGSDAATAFGTAEISIYLLALNNRGTAVSFGDGQISYAFVGGSLDATEQANLHTALNAYMTGLADDYA